MFGIDTYEIINPTQEALARATSVPGHYTIRVAPLMSKQLLHEYDFYYCDTLIEPYCMRGKLKNATHPDCSIGKEACWQELLPICHNAFTYGRFHRDFNISSASADLRYDNWLRELYDQQRIYGLYWRNELGGFIAHADNSLVLHAVAEAYRGRGFAKYWWGQVCNELFDTGYTEVHSSISATNMAALNLYVSLGFSFRNPVDMYHRLVG